MLIFHRTENLTRNYATMQGENYPPDVTIASMDGVGKRLSALMEERNLSGAEIGRQVGVSRMTVSAWKRGLTADLKARHINRLAQILGVNPRWLETGFGPKEGPNPAVAIPQVRYDVPNTGTTPLRSVPVLKWDQASSYRGGDVPGAVERVPVAAEVGPLAFALRQQGNAMEPRIADGAYVVIDPHGEYSHGSIVLCKRPADPQAILRQLWFDGGLASLRALNESYPVLDMPSNTVVIGKAVLVQSVL